MRLRSPVWIEKKCETCGKTFRRLKSQGGEKRRFCDYRCRDLGNSRPKLPRYTVKLFGDEAHIEVGGKTVKIDARDLPLLYKFHWSLNERSPNRSYAQAALSYYDGITNRATTLYMHRIIMGNPAGVGIDHINGDGLDNRRSNLRICTNAQNSRNSRTQANTKSGFKGVTKHKELAKNPWTARIGVDGQSKYLGCFPTAEQAARAYDLAALFFFGEFAKTNFDQSEYITRTDQGLFSFSKTKET